MRELQQIEKLLGRKLERAESEWPMQVFTETVKQPRPPRPSRQERQNPGSDAARKDAGAGGRAAGGTHGGPARRNGTIPPNAGKGTPRSARRERAFPHHAQ